MSPSGLSSKSRRQYSRVDNTLPEALPPQVDYLAQPNKHLLSFSTSNGCTCSVSPRLHNASRRNPMSTEEDTGHLNPRYSNLLLPQVALSSLLLLDSKLPFLLRVHCLQRYNHTHQRLPLRIPNWKLGLRVSVWRERRGAEKAPGKSCQRLHFYGRR